MNQIQPYDPETFKTDFVNSNIHTQLSEDFDVITWNLNEPTHTGKSSLMTPREWRGKRIVSAVPFYYIEQLTHNNETIYDIGCGWNLYKRYYDVVGLGGEEVDSPSYHADEHCWFDSEYAKLNKERFNNVMSMNALHFIALNQLPELLSAILYVTKPGGRVFLMLNMCHLLNANHQINDNKVIAYIRDTVAAITDTVLLFELDEALTTNMSEGTFRILLQKAR